MFCWWSARLDGRGARLSTGGFRVNAKMRFSGKVALVAGGTGGLGRAVSLAFLEEGAKVIVTYREPREWDELKGLGGANISSLAGQRIDVTDEKGVEQFVQKVVAE